jgi:hypothetical protein
LQQATADPLPLAPGYWQGWAIQDAHDTDASSRDES